MRFKNVALTSRTIWILALGALVLIGLYAFLSSQVGQIALVVCCGGGLVVAVAALIAESR